MSCSAGLTNGLICKEELSVAQTLHALAGASSEQQCWAGRPNAAFKAHLELELKGARHDQIFIVCAGAPGVIAADPHHRVIKGEVQHILGRRELVHLVRSLELARAESLAAEVECLGPRWRRQPRGLHAPGGQWVATQQRILASAAKVLEQR